MSRGPVSQCRKPKRKRDVACAHSCMDAMRSAEESVSSLSTVVVGAMQTDCCHASALAVRVRSSRCSRLRWRVVLARRL